MKTLKKIIFISIVLGMISSLIISCKNDDKGQTGLLTLSTLEGKIKIGDYVSVELSLPHPDLISKIVVKKSIEGKEVSSYLKELNVRELSFPYTFTEEIIFIADHIINVLNTNQTLLTFISKNLSWGIFKEALTTNVADDDINFKDIYYEMLEDSGLNLNEPEIMLFMIVELISSTCYSSILYKEPADIDRLKPYLYKAIKAIINEHTIED